jgi:hypothetical protein
MCICSWKLFKSKFCLEFEKVKKRGGRIAFLLYTKQETSSSSIICKRGKNKILSYSVKEKNTNRPIIMQVFSTKDKFGGNKSAPPPPP